MFILLMLNLPYLGMSYHKYNYENRKEGEEVRNAERQKNFLCILPSYRVIKSLVGQNKSMTIEDSCAIR